MCYVCAASSILSVSVFVGSWYITRLRLTTQRGCVCLIFMDVLIRRNDDVVKVH
jgi:hypothetical protein